MRKILVWCLVLGGGTLAIADVDWSQPPAACVEEIVPHMPTDCPHWKANQSLFQRPEEVSETGWQDWLERPNQALDLCMAVETMKRAPLRSAERNLAFTLLKGAEDPRGDKVETIYKSAQFYKMPPQVLTGALMQELALADMAIVSDFGNYSCGTGQLNLNEWCEWVQQLPPEFASQLGWPVAAIDYYRGRHPEIKNICESSSTGLRPADLKPFVVHALKRHRGLPEYMIESQHLVGTTFKEALPYYRKSAKDFIPLKFAMARSFAATCSDHRLAIPAKAFTLAKIYAEEVPAELKSLREDYSEEITYQRPCLHPTNGVFPMHTGWLLADAIYNSGSEVLDGIVYFRGRNDWLNYNPRELIGDLEKIADAGSKFVASPQQRAEVKQHISSVVKFITLPGHNVLPDQ